MSNVPQIQGMAELLARLQQAPQSITSEVSGALAEGTYNIANDAKLAAPADQGFLRNQIGADKQGPLAYEVYSNAEYSAFVEFGTLEKADIPPGLEEYAAQFKASGGSDGGLTLKEAIFAWCQRQGIDQKLWYAIYVSIAVNGVEPQPFFFPAVNRQTPIIINRVNEALKDAL